MSTTNPLVDRIQQATSGDLPDGDRMIEVGPALDGPCDAVAFLPGRIVVAADVDEDWVSERLHSQQDGRPEDRSSGLGRFVAAMVERLDRPAAYASVLTAAPHRAAMVRGSFTRSGAPDRGWVPYRTDVMSYRFDNQGVVGAVDIGRGPGGRWDTFVRVDHDARSGDGDSRQVLAAALTLVSKGEYLYGSAPVHDIRALRTMLAGGFRPICTEVLFLTRPHHGGNRTTTQEQPDRSDPESSPGGPSGRGRGRLSRLLRGRGR